MEYVYNVSIVCGLIKTSIFSQEIFHKERIPEGSHEENDALVYQCSALNTPLPPSECLSTRAFKIYIIQNCSNLIIKLQPKEPSLLSNDL